MRRVSRTPKDGQKGSLSRFTIGVIAKRKLRPLAPKPLANVTTLRVLLPVFFEVPLLQTSESLGLDPSMRAEGLE